MARKNERERVTGVLSFYHTIIIYSQSFLTSFLPSFLTLHLTSILHHGKSSGIGSRSNRNGASRAHHVFDGNGTEFLWVLSTTGTCERCCWSVRAPLHSRWKRKWDGRSCSDHDSSNTDGRHCGNAKNPEFRRYGMIWYGTHRLPFIQTSAERPSALAPPTDDGLGTMGIVGSS